MIRNFGLDIMRSLSIWLVLLQHRGIDFSELAPLRIGVIGVEIFFVISGFLIGGILFKEIDKKNTFLQTLKSFWVRRWLRILPLYYLILLFKFFFIDSSIGVKILYYIFFLQNNFYGINYFEVSWSLVIEEWFYLFTPIFLLITISLFKSDKNIFIAMLLFILFINIIRAVYVIHNNVPYQGINGNFPFRFDSLFLGVALSFLNYKKWLLYEWMASVRVFYLGILLFVIYIYYYWSLSHLNLIDKSLLPRTLGFFILPFTIALTIPFISRIKFDSKRNILSKFFFSFINTTSILTFGIYLIHPLVYLLNYNILVSVLFTYILSYIVYIGYEKPILNYRDKITGSKIEAIKN